MEQDPFAQMPQTEPLSVEAAVTEPAVSTLPQRPEGDSPQPSVVSPAPKHPIPVSNPETPRVEVSAATVTRMMGIASTADLRLLEGRVDLLTSKVTGLLTKVDRVLSMFGSIPTSSDIGRLEIQMGSIKSMLRELMEVQEAMGAAKRQPDTQEAADEQGRKLKEGIRSSSE